MVAAASPDVDWLRPAHLTTARTTTLPPPTPGSNSASMKALRASSRCDSTVLAKVSAIGPHWLVTPASSPSGSAVIA